MDVLSFMPRGRLEEQPAGARVNSAMDGYRRPREYIDILVNGRSLADLCDVDRRDLIGMLEPEDLKNPLPSQDVFNMFKRMGRLPRELALEIPVLYENRRVHIYGCPECGDLECGSVTMQLLETPTSVIWQKFDDGREKIAAYITEDKSFHDTNLLDLWLTEGKNYGILHGFVASEHEYDYEFIYSYKNNKYIVERDADIRTDLTPTVDYPAVGPFEFEKSQYLAAWRDLAMLYA
jgi:hypothetical protein